MDLTELIAGERGVTVDAAGFERALEEQRTRSRAARGSGRAAPGAPAVGAGKKAKWHIVRRGRQKFVGYQTTEAETEPLAFRQEGERVELILHQNPFYLESGGQVSDTGVVRGPEWTVSVDSVRKDERGTVVGGRFGAPFEPAPVLAAVEAGRRRNIERNHSATHLVHLALRRHLGPHVRQQGSLVAPERLRFDFSHHGPVEPEMLERIERDVNEQIWDDARVTTREMPYPEALALGAMAFFADKYGDVVRVVQMGDSIELCGGTHVATTGVLGLFRFTGQRGVAAGVRRIEAVTGPGAAAALDEIEERLRHAGELLKAQPEHVARRIEQLLAEREKLEARVKEMQRRGGGAEVEGERIEVRDVAVPSSPTGSGRGRAGPSSSSLAPTAGEASTSPSPTTWCNAASRRAICSTGSPR